MEAAHLLDVKVSRRDHAFRFIVRGIDDAHEVVTVLGSEKGVHPLDHPPNLLGAPRGLFDGADALAGKTSDASRPAGAVGPIQSGGSGASSQASGSLRAATALRGRRPPTEPLFSHLLPSNPAPGQTVGRVGPVL